MDQYGLALKAFFLGLLILLMLDIVAKTIKPEATIYTRENL